MNTKLIKVTEADEGVRLDRWFKRVFPHITHSYLEKLLRKGSILLDGHKVTASSRLQTGQTLSIPSNLETSLLNVPSPKKPSLLCLKPSDEVFIQQNILYQDPDMIVFNKPAGLAVQGGTKTLRALDGLLKMFSQHHFKETWKLVHRLDKDTSGLLLVARHTQAATWLTRAFHEKSVKKIYWALVVGTPSLAQGTLKNKICKLPGRAGEKMVVNNEEGEEAVTHYRVEREFPALGVSQLILEPLTGRTHQLRVHCAFMGTPIVGDGKYGAKHAFPFGRCRLHLHAQSLTVKIPSGRVVTFVSPVPEELYSIVLNTQNE